MHQSYIHVPGDMPLHEFVNRYTLGEGAAPDTPVWCVIDPYLLLFSDTFMNEWETLKAAAKLRGLKPVLLTTLDGPDGNWLCHIGFEGA